MLECVKYKHIGSIREIVEIVYRSSRGVGSGTVGGSSPVPGFV